MTTVTPCIVNGWIVDEEPAQNVFGDKLPTVTATHMLSGVTLQWVENTYWENERPPISVVWLGHPASKSRPISTHMETKDEARAFITTVIGAQA